MSFSMKLPEFTRNKVSLLFRRLQEEQPFIQVITGPRQVGKTTALLQIIEKWPGPTLYASADSPAPPGPEWIEQHWQAALEVKSGAFTSPHSGLSLFQKRWPTAKTWLIGPGGLELADFFQISPADLL